MMGAPVPLYRNIDWREHPGAELASVPGESDAQVADQIGLAYDPDSSRWVSPRLHALRTQKISVHDLDDEELIRGQVRDNDGKFRAGPARKIPREFHDELMRRIVEKGIDKMRDYHLTAAETMVEIMEDQTNDAALRFKAAQYIFERTAGKTPEVVQATVQVKPWENVMQAIVREIPQGEIEEAVVVEDEPEVRDDTVH